MIQWPHPQIHVADKVYVHDRSTALGSYCARVKRVGQKTNGKYILAAFSECDQQTWTEIRKYATEYGNNVSLW